MPANKSSLGVYLMGTFHSKVIYQKCASFTYIGNDYSKKLKTTANYAFFMNQINIY